MSRFQCFGRAASARWGRSPVNVRPAASAAALGSSLIIVVALIQHRVPAGGCVNPTDGERPGATAALPGRRGRVLKRGPDRPQRAFARQDRLARERASWLNRPNACAGDSAQESCYVEQVVAVNPVPSVSRVRTLTHRTAPGSRPGGTEQANPLRAHHLRRSRNSLCVPRLHTRRRNPVLSR